MKAGYLVVDSRVSALNEAGDLIIPHKEGAIPDPAAHIKAELGELVLRPPEASAWAGAQFTIFKSLGLAVEDLACAEYLYQKAKSYSKGTELQL